MQRRPASSPCAQRPCSASFYIPQAAAPAYTGTAAIFFACIRAILRSRPRVAYRRRRWDSRSSASFAFAQVGGLCSTVSWSAASAPLAGSLPSSQSCQPTLTASWLGADAVGVRAEAVAVPWLRFMQHDVGGFSRLPIQPADEDVGMPAIGAELVRLYRDSLEKDRAEVWLRGSRLRSPPRSRYAPVLPMRAMAAWVPRHSLAVTMARVMSQPRLAARSSAKVSRIPPMPPSRLAVISEAAVGVSSRRSLSTAIALALPGLDMCRVPSAITSR